MRKATPRTPPRPSSAKKEIRYQPRASEAPRYELRFVPWTSSDLVRSLQSTLKQAAEDWVRAALAAPQNPAAQRILRVARALHALDFAIEFGEDDYLKETEDLSRPFLRRFEADVVGRTAPEQAEAIEERLAHLARANIASQDLDGLAQVFLVEVDREGDPMARKLAQAEIAVARHRPGTVARRDLLPDVVERVKVAFGGLLQRLRPTDSAIGERLTIRGLEAIGYPGARDVFSYRARRAKRAAKAPTSAVTELGPTDDSADT